MPFITFVPIWGNITVCEETVENRFQFNGQQYDAITQQYYLRARFYNPVIARFTQEDTYRGAGLNLYDYCANNPVYYEDPSGNVPQCVKEAAQKYMDEGMSKENAYRKANQEYEKTNIEANLMGLIDKAQKGTLTKAEYEQLNHYSRLLGAGDSLTYGNIKNPVVQAMKNRTDAINSYNALLRSQRGQTPNGADRTVASNGTIRTVSGFSERRMSKKQLKNFRTDIDYDDIIRRGRNAGYEMPTNASLDHGYPGYGYACHAEKQMYSLDSNIIGVSRDMCSSCEDYFTHVSGYENKNIYIADPSNMHIFTSMGIHFKFH